MQAGYGQLKAAWADGLQWWPWLFLSISCFLRLTHRKWQGWVGATQTRQEEDTPRLLGIRDFVGRVGVRCGTNDDHGRWAAD